MSGEQNILQAWWLKHREPQTPSLVEVLYTKQGFVRVPAITCADGFKMSVQGSYSHYCTPRETLDDGAYTHWEVGFPSERVESLMEYAEDPERPTETVYSYVPTAVVVTIIESHGGIADRPLQDRRGSHGEPR